MTTSRAESGRPEIRKTRAGTPVGWTTGLFVAVLLCAGIVRPASARAQSWAFVDMVGYGAAGGGLGLAATWGADCSDFFCGTTIASTLGGAALGAVVGSAIGGNADELVRTGRPLSGRHRTAVAAGTVLAGAASGALASAVLINGEGEGTFLGSDEQTFGLMSVVGAGVGAFILRSRWDELTGAGEASFSVTPAVLDGRPGVVTRLDF